MPQGKFCASPAPTFDQRHYSDSSSGSKQTIQAGPGKCLVPAAHTPLSVINEPFQTNHFTPKWRPFAAEMGQLTPLRDLLRVGRGTPNPKMDCIALVWPRPSIHKRSFGPFPLLEVFLKSPYCFRRVLALRNWGMRLCAPSGSPLHRRTFAGELILTGNIGKRERGMPYTLTACGRPPVMRHNHHGNAAAKLHVVTTLSAGASNLVYMALAASQRVGPAPPVKFAPHRVKSAPARPNPH